MKNRFIAVSHHWFTGSEGLSVIELNSKSRHEAEKEAALIQVESHSNFKRCATIAVEIGSDEVLMPRKLTWKERLTGKISN